MGGSKWFGRVAGVLVLAFQSLVCQAEVLRVAVASNFMTPMEAIAAAFRAASGHELLLSFGSSGTFYAQISNGAPFDVLLSADRDIPRRLEDDGKVVPGSRFTYARGRLVLWSADPALIDGAALDADAGRLLQLSFRRLALANPVLAPYGRAAEQVLDHIDPADSLKAKLVRGENISQAYQFVATRNAELGFVALSQVLDPEGGWLSGSGWLVPEAFHEEIAQDVVWLQGAAGKPAAGELLEFLRGETARAIMRAQGYGVGD